MSHAAVANPLETLSEGLSIEAIRRRLDNEVVGHHVYVFGAVASTNAVLRRCADAGAREGTVVLAEEQRQGRGRLGQPWFSPPGVNLYASVLFRPDLRPETLPAFASIASLALVDAIGREGVPAEIRDPNDVLVGGQKVAGILVECTTTAGRMDYVILGVGVNVNVTRVALRDALGGAAAGATSLRETVGRQIDRNVFAAAFLGFLEKWFDLYAARGPVAVTSASRSRLVPAGVRAPGAGGNRCA